MFRKLRTSGCLEKNQTFKHLFNNSVFAEDCFKMSCLLFVMGGRDKKAAPGDRLIKIIHSICIIFGLLYHYKLIYQIQYWRWFKCHLSQAIQLVWGVLHNSFAVKYCTDDSGRTMVDYNWKLIKKFMWHDNRLCFFIQDVFVLYLQPVM